MNQKFSIAGQYVDFDKFNSSKVNFSPYFLNSGTLTMSGRSALILLLEKFNKNKSKKIYLPGYVCETIPKNLISLGFKIHFYDIFLNSKIDKLFEEQSIVIVVHYFGNENKISSKLKNSNLIILEDYTHCMLNNLNAKFNKRNVFMSLRKFTGLPFGGWTNIKENINTLNNKKILKKEKIIYKYLNQKKTYIKNESEFSLKLENKFLKLNKDNEILLDKNILNYPIPKISNNILSCYNWKIIRKKRIENWKYLNKNLKNKFEVFPKKIQDNVCPLYFIIITTKRDQIRNHLISKRIFVANSWKKISDLNYRNLTKSIFLFKNILYIPLDQRLEKFHLNIIIQNLLFYGKN